MNVIEENFIEILTMHFQYNPKIAWMRHEIIEEFNKLWTQYIDGVSIENLKYSKTEKD